MIGSYEAGVTFSLWTKRLRKKLRDLYTTNGFSPENSISIYYIHADKKWGCTLYIDREEDLHFTDPNPWALGEEFSSFSVEELFEKVQKNFPKRANQP